MKRDFRTDLTPEQEDVRRYTFDRTVIVIVSDASRGDANEEPLTSGTGLLVRVQSRAFVITAGHIIEAFIEARNRLKTNARLQVHTLIGNDRVAYRGFHAQVEQTIVEDHEITPQRIDVGLIELQDSAVTTLQNKTFFLERDLLDDPASVGLDVLYLGFRLEGKSHLEKDALINGVFFSPDNRVAATGFTSVTQIVQNESFGATLASPKKTSGSPLELPLKGISGAPVVDMNRRLAGLIWGGDPEGTEVYANNLLGVRRCIDCYLSLT